jgi:phi13 family phage major tail protein
MATKSAQIGLRDLHAAKLDDGSYSEVRSILGSTEATMTVNQDEAILYADDIAFESTSNISSVEVSLSLANLSNEEIAFLLGSEIDEDGVLIESSDDVAPEVAFGFRSEKANGEFRYVWLYRGTFQTPEETYQTKGDSTEFQTPSISGTFMARQDDGRIRAKVDSDDEEVSSDVISNWFEAPYGYGDGGDGGES